MDTADLDPLAVPASVKTTRPRIPNVLIRERCLRALDKADQVKILCICGRAGQGKTTLAVSWLQQIDFPSVWLSLDEGDNDPAALLSLIADAYRTAFPHHAIGAISIPVGAPIDIAVFARAYFRHLLSQTPPRHVITLDDTHVLSEEGAAPLILQALIESLPDAARLLLVSRRRPPPFLTKWIAARQLIVVDETALSFTDDEVAALFATVLNNPLTEAQAASVKECTEGWVTGLILMHHSRVGVDERVALDHVSEPLVFDYLYHEIYRRLAMPLQTIMLRTSLVDAFSLDSARRFVPDIDIAIHLRALRNQHLVTEVTAGKSTQYRYHALLREFLRRRVAAMPEAERRAWVEHAASVLEMEDKPDQAIDLCLAHGLHGRAVVLIERIGMRLTLEGRSHTLHQWISMLPSAMSPEHPWLYYFLGSGQGLANYPAAVQSYALALAGFQKNGDAEGELWTFSARMMLEIYVGENFRLITIDGACGRTLLRRRDTKHMLMARAALLMAAGFSGFFCSEDLRKELNMALAAVAIARRTGVVPLITRALVCAGFTAGHMGRHRDALMLFDEADALITTHRLDAALRAEALLCRGVIETFWSVEHATPHLLEAAQVCHDFGVTLALPPIHAQLAWSRQFSKGNAEALPLRPCHEWRPQVMQSHIFVSLLSHVEALIASANGEHERALQLQMQSVRMIKRSHGRFVSHIAIYRLGVIWCDLGKAEKGKRLLLQSLAAFERARSDYWAYTVALQMAKVALSAGDEDEARHYLSRALCHGKTERYVMIEGMSSPMMTRLLRRARQWGLEPHYVHYLTEQWEIHLVPKLQIHTLGRFEVSVGGQSIPDVEWHGRKTRLLLIALLTLGGQQVSKEAIMDCLWPDAEGDRAVTSFHTTLHRLQTVLGKHGTEGSYLQLHQGVLSLHAEHCYSDCCAFDTAVRLARYAETAGRWVEARRHMHTAAELYQGDFLPAFKEPWIEARRQTLRQQYAWIEQRLQRISL